MFPFGFSVEELLTVVVVLTIAGGYRSQFLGASRNAGVFVGRTVGFIRQKREQVFTSKSQKREIESLHNQLSAAVSELQHIRYGIRTASPIDVSHRTEQGSEESSKRPSAEQRSLQDADDSAPNHSASISTMLSESREQAAPFNIVDPLSSAGVGSSRQHGADGLQGKLPHELFEQIGDVDPSCPATYIAGVRLVPISAKDVMAVGKGPHTGSHIAKDALLEREVAEKASSVFGLGERQS
jgi:hypothetical protein